MGRKGECGGTAGGGRSGRRGNLTYNRVIPKFLRDLADPESIGNPLDAKRPWATGHIKVQRSQDQPVGQTAERQQNINPEDEIRILEAQGFNVVTEAQETQQGGKERNGSYPDLGGAKTAARASDNKVRVSGGIEKKSKRTTTVGKAFDMRNRNKLSFVESDSEDE